jgi:hypothetical protein
MQTFFGGMIHENGGMVAWKRLKISLWGLTSPTIYFQTILVSLRTFPYF